MLSPNFLLYPEATVPELPPAEADPEERPEVPDGEDPEEAGPPERPPGGEEAGDGCGDPDGEFEPLSPPFLNKDEDVFCQAE